MKHPIRYLQSRLAKAGGPVERANLIGMITQHMNLLEAKANIQNMIDSAEGVSRFLKPQAS